MYKIKKFHPILHHCPSVFYDIITANLMETVMYWQIIAILDAVKTESHENQRTVQGK